MRRAARAVLVAAVRGRRDQGGPWGEAVLAEFDQTRGGWEAVCWTAGGLRAVVQERFSAYAPRNRRIVATAVLGVVSMLAINQFVLTARYVPSSAMAPTVPVSGRVLLDKASFRITGLHYGDVVEFPVPDVPDRLTIKRVVGLPGDTVDCRDGHVFRDGMAVDEPYLAAGSRTECTPATVPAGKVFVLGDNRLGSADSRQWGPIDQANVDGRLLAIF
jgi:signal peptidase I